MKTLKQNDFGDYFYKKAIKLKKSAENTYFISPAAARSTGLRELKEIYPNHVYDTGINEQHCVTFSASVALNNNRVICFIPATFLARAIDQIIDVSLQNIPITFVLLYPGIGATGPTHQGIYTFPFLNTLQNVELYNPQNIEQFDKLLDMSLKKKCPVFLQKPSNKFLDIKETSDILEVKKGSKLTILCLGNTLESALKISKSIENLQVLQALKIKPFNTRMLLKLMGKNKKLVILEDGVTKSGIGEHISYELNKAGNNCKIRVLGIRSKYPEIGNLDEVYTDIGLGNKNILNTVQELINE